MRLVRSTGGFACLLAIVLARTAVAADVAHIPGGAWRSILPAGGGQESVQVASFDIDRVPVTNGEFLAFVKRHRDWQRGRAPALFADREYLRSWKSPTELGTAADAAQPVTSVSWYAARAFCEARGARLPTWNEWELVAAADEQHRDARASPAWQQQILGWYSRPSTGPLPRVGRRPPNVYGARDMHGLVWEWVEDFNALMVSDDSREQGDPDKLEFCGSGALAFENRDEYAIAMRVALLSSLQASSTTINLGFRCATASPASQARGAESVAALPSDSVYLIDAALQTATGQAAPFSARRGRLQLVTMFYSSCSVTCPMTIEALRSITQTLTPAERAKIDVLLVSIDPQHDTPQVLRQVARDRHVTDPRWTLARTSLPDTRKLAAALGVQYRQLASGDFEHSSVLVLLDSAGRIRARSSQLAAPDPDFIRAIRSVATP